MLAVALVLALAWLLLADADTAPGASGARPAPEVAGLATLLVLVAVSLVLWVLDPFTALLLLPALHLSC